MALSKEIQERIKQDGKAYMHSEIKGMVGDEEFTLDSLKRAYIAGATAEAECLQAEIDGLNNLCNKLESWKREASEVLAPVMEYAQGHPEAKLGSSLAQFVVDRCKAYDQLMQDHQAMKEREDKYRTALRNISIWCEESGLKKIALDDKNGVAIYHSMHLAKDALAGREVGDDA